MVTSKFTLEAQTFRVISVEEQDGINYAITALTYIDGKYANIESGISLPARSISLLNEPKDPPSNLQASERIVVINALAVTKLILSWVSVTGVSQYLVQYRFNNTNWVSQIVLDLILRLSVQRQELMNLKYFRIMLD